MAVRSYIFFIVSYFLEASILALEGQLWEMWQAIMGRSFRLPQALNAVSFVRKSMKHLIM